MEVQFWAGEVVEICFPRRTKGKSTNRVREAFPRQRGNRSES